jgi:hypothetical protein
MAGVSVSEEVMRTDIYRAFDVAKKGWFKWEPIFICMVDNKPVTYHTFTYFWSKLQATRVSLLMNTQYNDGLWEMNKHPLQEKSDGEG